MRRTLATILILPALVGQAPEDKPEMSARERREKLLKLYRGEAAGYSIYRDRDRTEKVELRPDPAYSWTNPVRGGEQDGDVFIWTCRGRVEVVGTFFSYPSTGPRSLNHEFHSLSTSVLSVDRSNGANTWTPKAPGISLSKIPIAPEPARTPSLRLAQIRELSRGFTASSVDFDAKRWDLRLLPQPLFREESTDPDVLDGALFAFVTSAGTDPEVLLVIEARREPGAVMTSWHYAIARFSDLTLSVKWKGKEVFTAPPIPHDAPEQDPKQRYRTFRDRGIPAIEIESSEPTRPVRLAPPRGENR